MPPFTLARRGKALNWEPEDLDSSSDLELTAVLPWTPHFFDFKHA